MKDKIPALVRMRLALIYVYNHESVSINDEGLMTAVRECFSLSSTDFCVTVTDIAGHL